MFKFWKSKTKSPKPSAQSSKAPSPTPPDPPKRPPTPSHALHGLGLSVPPREETSTSTRRDFSSSTAPSVASSRLSPEPLAAGSSVGHGGETGSNGYRGDGKSRRGSDQSAYSNVLREKSINVQDFGRKPYPEGLEVPYGRSDRALSPASFATTASVLPSRYPAPYGAENGGFPDNDPTQIHGQSRPSSWTRSGADDENLQLLLLGPRWRTKSSWRIFRLANGQGRRSCSFLAPVLSTPALTIRSDSWEVVASEER